MPPTVPGRGGPPGGKLRKGVGGKVRPNNGLSGKVPAGYATHRHRKILKDNILGITKPAIRRLARRGGVKRVSAMIYDEVRVALLEYLKRILSLCSIYVEHRNAKTVTVHDVLHSLDRIGRPIYGFDPDSYHPTKKGPKKG